jgi:glycosyltransferase involved in cell wall biosynthesis
MKYSIILPVRNGGHYIKKCVASILSQTRQDYNLIVLENCSTDGTAEWLRNINNPKISVIEAPRSLSIEENWQRITGIKKNKFITLIGHDDLLDHHYLEVMDTLIAQHPTATLYQAHFRFIDSEGKFIRPCKPMQEKESAVAFLSSVLQNRFDLFGTGFMLRSEDYDREGGIPFYPNLLFADFQLWMEVTKKGYKATAEKESFSYRLHHSTTKSSSDLKMQEAFGQFIAYLQSIQQQSPEIDEAIKKYFIGFLGAYSKGLSHRLIRTPVKERRGLTVDKFLQQSRSYADQLVPENNYDPYAIKSVKLAALIDRNLLLNRLYQLR